MSILFSTRGRRGERRHLPADKSASQQHIVQVHVYTQAAGSPHGNQQSTVKACSRRKYSGIRVSETHSHRVCIVNGQYTWVDISWLLFTSRALTCKKPSRHILTAGGTGQAQSQLDSLFVTKIEPETLAVLFFQLQGYQELNVDKQHCSCCAVYVGQ